MSKRELISNQIYNIVYKTNKTNKTEALQRLESWFSTVDIKPIKPNCIQDDFSLVFYGRIIPLNREVFSVFSVFTAFLCQIDEKRYKKYYEDYKPTEEKKVLNDKIQEAAKIILNNPEDNYELIQDKYGQGFIDKCLEQKLFCEPICGKKLEVI